MGISDILIKENRWSTELYSLLFPNGSFPATFPAAVKHLSLHSRCFTVSFMNKKKTKTNKQKKNTKYSRSLSIICRLLQNKATFKTGKFKNSIFEQLTCWTIEIRKDAVIEKCMLWHSEMHKAYVKHICVICYMIGGQFCTLFVCGRVQFLVLYISRIEWMNMKAPVPVFLHKSEQTFSMNVTPPINLAIVPYHIISYYYQVIQIQNVFYFHWCQSFIRNTPTIYHCRCQCRT